MPCFVAALAAGRHCVAAFSADAAKLHKVHPRNKAPARTKKVESPEKSENSTFVAPSEIITNLFIECFIPDYVVQRSVRFNYDSDLVTFLRTLLDPFVVEGLIDEYRIGVTKSRSTIFFQIDQEGRCRTGKIMKYDSETGHRIKDPNVPGRITWVHSLMKYSGMLPPE